MDFCFVYMARRSFRRIFISGLLRQAHKSECMFNKYQNRRISGKIVKVKVNFGSNNHDIL